MKTLISMDPVGRLVLPKRIRQSLNAPRTAVFEVAVLGNRLELTLTEPEPAKLRRKGKLLVVPRQGVVLDAVKAVDDTRKANAERVYTLTHRHFIALASDLSRKVVSP